MENNVYPKIIRNYIKAYNNFNVDQMLADMHENIRFENITNGETNLVTNGLAELKAQAEQAKQFFKEREQTITRFTFDKDQVEINIDYKGVLAIDFPNGLKAGDTIELKGKSIFTFEGNKIIALKDIS
jgi:hypothetical protein